MGRRFHGEGGMNRNITVPEPPIFKITSGVPCEVRRRGDEAWRPHRTTTGRLFGSCLWRDEGWYGFASGEWEMKVSREHVQEIPG